jgi:hypothetical protein
MDLAEQATTGEGENRTYGLAFDYSRDDVEVLLDGRGVILGDATANPPQAYLNQSETQDFVQWMVDQAQEGVLYPVSLAPIGSYPDEFIPTRELIQAGRVAFWITWLEEIDTGGYYQLANPDFEIRVAPLPKAAGDPGSQALRLSYGQYVSPRAENPAACWEWMTYLSEHPADKGMLPARRSVRAADAWQSLVGSETAQVLEAALAQRGPLYGGNRAGLRGPVWEWWRLALAKAFHGEGLGGALDEAQSKADVYTACLAGSSEYQVGTAGQQAQAEEDCARQADPQWNSP